MNDCEPQIISQPVISKTEVTEPVVNSELGEIILDNGVVNTLPINTLGL